MNKNNKFLTELLGCEVNGSNAISSPTGWRTKPLLEVETEIDQLVEEIAPLLIEGNTTDRKKQGVWWFLVGSPGNGKSAAVGSLVRTLEEKYKATFRIPTADHSHGQEINELEPNHIPYKLELYEEGKSYASAVFAQDASVVPNPYVKSPNTGLALIQLLKDASSRGQSVVVCANRGIIEKAVAVLQQDKSSQIRGALNYLNKDLADTTSERDYRIDFEKEGQRNLVFEEVKVKVTALDEKSLLSGSNKTFLKLMNKATDDESWKVCDSCDSKNLCPFKNNRDWLNHSEVHKKRFTDVLSFGELISGQAMVIREALAFISLIFAGSSRDYKQNNTTPCDWVHENIKNNLLFSLLSRRIYMILFQSHSPFGLDSDKNKRKAQIDSLTSIKLGKDEINDKSIKGLRNSKLATDLGLERFLSVFGAFEKIDPIKESQKKPLENKWNITLGNTDALQEGQPLISTLEIECFKVWENCEKSIDTAETKEQAFEYYNNLRRWVTGVTLRLGYFAEGEVLFQKELEDYQNYLESDINNLTYDEDELHDSIPRTFSNFLFRGREKKIRVSEVMEIYGGGIDHDLKITLGKKPSMTRRIEITVNKKPIEFTPICYVWASRKERTKLLEGTLPTKINELANDMRFKVTSSVDYSIIDDVYVNIKLQNTRKELELKRKRNRLKPRKLS